MPAGNNSPCDSTIIHCRNLYFCFSSIDHQNQTQHPLTQKKKQRKPPKTPPLSIPKIRTEGGGFPGNKQERIRKDWWPPQDPGIPLVTLSQNKSEFLFRRVVYIVKQKPPVGVKIKVLVSSFSVTQMTDMKGITSADADTCNLRKQWDETLCPICMDHPHNAVLILCDSHEKGCRSYICDTSYRHSNCLDRFKKLRINLSGSPSQTSSFIESSSNERQELNSLHPLPSENILSGIRTGRNLLGAHDYIDLEENNSSVSMGLLEPSVENNNQVSHMHLETQEQQMMELDESGAANMSGDSEQEGNLKCPLCRGVIIDWKIDKEARQYLDMKPRSCSRESCSFSGNYKELRRHARRAHPTTRPADVDPSRQRAWRRMEHQREYGDILSAIRSAMPDAIVLGDYVIENGDRLSRDRERVSSNEGNRPWWTTLFLFHMISNPLGSLDDGRSSSRAWRRHRRSSGHRNLWGENLLGLQDDDDRDLDLDDSPVPRRRRRFGRSRPDEDLP